VNCGSRARNSRNTLGLSPLTPNPFNLPAFQQVYDDHLATLPGVQRLSSTLVMKTISENRPLPLD
jgi:hypothetical protein